MSLCIFLYGLDVHPCLIKGRAKHIVHRRIHQRKVMVRRRFKILHLHDQHACVGGNRASGLKHELYIAVTQHLPNRSDVLGDGGRLLIAVMYAQSAAQIQMANDDAQPRQRID